MQRTEALDRLTEAPSGHLATVRPDGRPHVVVVTFAVSGETIFTAIDHKPKTTTRLQRLANIEANPQVSFLVDNYDDDWTRLWWVRVDGSAEVAESGARHEAGVRALIDKYPQYRATPPEGPVISITASQVSGWASTP